MSILREFLEHFESILAINWIFRASKYFVLLFCSVYFWNMYLCLVCVTGYPQVCPPPIIGGHVTPVSSLMSLVTLPRPHTWSRAQPGSLRLCQCQHQGPHWARGITESQQPSEMSLILTMPDRFVYNYIMSFKDICVSMLKTKSARDSTTRHSWHE